MTRQDFLKKWLFYGLILVLTAGLQGQVFSRLRPLGVTPVLLPLAAAALASLEGPVGGAGFGVAVGVMATCLDKSPAWVILLLCVFGALTGLLAQHILSRSFLGYVICAVTALALREAWVVLTRWYGGVAPLPVLLRVGVPELLWSICLSPLIFLMFRFIHRRWGAGYYV